MGFTDCGFTMSFSRVYSWSRNSLSNTISSLKYSNMSRRSLDGRIAIVTASTEGIGFSIAKRLAEDGAKVVISSRKQRNVDAAVEKLAKEGLSVTGTVCHVGVAEDREKLIAETVAQFGGLDILVSNAAVNPTFGPILSCPENAWDKIFDINVKAAFLLAKQLFLTWKIKEKVPSCLYRPLRVFSQYRLLVHIPSVKQLCWD